MLLRVPHLLNRKEAGREIEHAAGVVSLKTPDFPAQIKTPTLKEGPPPNCGRTIDGPEP